MAYVCLLLFSLFLHNIDLVSATLYSCNSTAECGCSKRDAQVNKIVGGEAAVDSSWGWAVSLQRATGGAFCGGAIISPLHIITAAHCVTNTAAFIRDTKVVVGINTLSQSTSTTAQIRNVVRVFSHPQYNPKSEANDIAVLRLSQSLTISNTYSTAQLCLPHIVPTSSANNYPTVGSSLVAIGWGKLSFVASSVPSNLHLQQVTLNAMSAQDRMCKDTINDPQLQFCAGVVGGGKDTCQGDSGGPLMHFDANERRWVLAGITSYGQDCGHPSYAGVYTRASVYREWLQSVATDNFIELPVNGTNSTLIPSPTPTSSTLTSSLNATNSALFLSARGIVSSHWSFTLSLYLFTHR